MDASINSALAEARFCPRCAQPAQVTFPRSIVYPHCGYAAYFNPKPVAGVIPVAADGRVILLRRGFDPGKGSWTFPGGFVDLGESVEDAARRETDEELRIVVELGPLVGVYSRADERVVLIVFPRAGPRAAPGHPGGDRGQIVRSYPDPVGRARLLVHRRGAARRIQAVNAPAAPVSRPLPCQQGDVTMGALVETIPLDAVRWLQRTTGALSGSAIVTSTGRGMHMAQNAPALTAPIEFPAPPGSTSVKGGHVRPRKSGYGAGVAKTLAWADDAATEHDYEAALFFLAVVQADGNRLPREYLVKRDAWAGPIAHGATIGSRQRCIDAQAFRSEAGRSVVSIWSDS